MRRFLKYTAVGVSTFLFDLLLLVFMTDVLGIAYYISTAISFLIAVSINYAVSRKVVFYGTHLSWRRGYTYFIIAAVLGALLSAGLVTVLVHYFGLYYVYGRIIVAGIVGVANYFFNLFMNLGRKGK